MKGDFTRSTFRADKHFSGVLMQQGRVQLDADWNEQNDITRHRIETETIDVVGPTGTPKGAGGFSIITDPNTLPVQTRQQLTTLGILPLQAGNFLINRGRYYVEGTLCESEGVLSFTGQPDLPSTQPVGSDGIYLAYLDVWQRHITPIDDPSIRENALQGADTATRSRTVWQVKLLRAGNIGASITCGSDIPAWNALQAASGARLAARAQPEANQTNPCIIPASAGYRRLENQLYRVEIHRGGAPGVATFKWSRENGSVVAAIREASGSRVTIADVGPDTVRAFKSGDWAEIVDDSNDLLGTPGTLVQIDLVDIATRRITMRSAVPTIGNADLVRRPRLRRWDQTGNSATANGIVTGAGAVVLEGGIEITFSGGPFTTGEYWLIPARTTTGDIEWPRQGTTAIPQPPAGIRHTFARLALLRMQGGVLMVLEDCRRQFPALTAIAASDVSYNNANCDLIQARTVQEALDALCARERDCCALTVSPGPNWEQILSRIPDNTDAHICFRAGTYTVTRPVTLRNKGHITISGCGHGSHVTAPNFEQVFVFDRCRSVSIRTIRVSAGEVGSREERKRLNGAITVMNTPDVTIESTIVSCGAGAARAACCIAVRNGVDAGGPSVALPGSVRIKGCDLTVGHQQTGMLLVNTGRATVEDNRIDVRERPPFLGIATLVRNDRRVRAGLRRMMVAGLRGTATVETENPAVRDNAGAGGMLLRKRVQNIQPNTTVVVGGRTLNMFSTNSIANRWSGLIAAEPPAGITSDRDAFRYIYRLADRVLLGEVVADAVAPFRRWLDAIFAENLAVGSQGIVVAGRTATDIRIRDNTIDGMMQGIHIGVSHRETQRGTPDRTGTVSISGNTIGVRMSPEIPNERHGIFVGNVDTLLVQDNHISVRRAQGAERMRIEGIRIFGFLGRMAIVSRNHLVNATVGIVVNPLPPFGHVRAQWLVSDNVTPGAQQSVIAPARVRKVENYA